MTVANGRVGLAALTVAVALTAAACTDATEPAGRESAGATAMPIARSVVRDAPLPSERRVPTATPVAFDAIPCGAVTLRSTNAEVSCAERLLWSGALARGRAAGLVAIDTTSWERGARLLRAQLVLTGADYDLRGKSGRWRVQLVDVPATAAVTGLTLSRLEELPRASAALSWTLDADELRPGHENALDVDDEALRVLEARSPSGVLFFRVTGPSLGPNAFAWHAAGGDAPRLLATFDAYSAGGAGAGIEWLSGDGTPAETVP